MGSFNMGCGISNLTINRRDKVGFVLLQEHKSFLHRAAPTHKPGRPFHIYNVDTHLPYLPPIFGKYDDYGRIAKIEPSATTRLMEKQFNLPIQTIIDCAVDDSRYYDDRGVLFKTFTTFSEVTKDWNDTRNFDLILKHAGFEAVSTTDDNIKYKYKNYMLTTKDSHKWELLNLNEDSLSEKAREVFYGSSPFELLNVFNYYTGLLPGYPEKSWNTAEQLFKFSGMFFLKEVFVNVAHIAQEDSFTDTKYQEFIEAYLKWVNDKKTLTEDELFRVSMMNDTFTYFLREKTSYPFDRWDNLLMLEDDVDEMRNWHNLGTAMDALNRMFQPVFSGEQYGNNEASRLLNKVTNKILKKRFKKYEE